MRRMRILVTSIVVASLVVGALIVADYSTQPVQAAPIPVVLLNASGHITMLRVHNMGTGYGPAEDFLDAEVVIHLDSQANRGFGFQLRNDDQQPAREGMLNIMRDAFNRDWLVTIDYWIEQGKNNGEIIRVWITKPVLEE